MVSVTFEGVQMTVPTDHPCVKFAFSCAKSEEKTEMHLAFQVANNTADHPAAAPPTQSNAPANGGSPDSNASGLDGAAAHDGAAPAEALVLTEHADAHADAHAHADADADADAGVPMNELLAITDKSTPAQNAPAAGKRKASNSPRSAKKKAKGKRIVIKDPRVIEKYKEKVMNELEEKFKDEKGVPFADKTNPDVVEAYYSRLLIKYSKEGESNMGAIYREDENGEEKCNKDGKAFKYPRCSRNFMRGVKPPHVMPPLFPTEADFLRPGADKEAEEWAWKYARKEAVGKPLNGKPWVLLTDEEKETRIKKSYTNQMHGYTDFVELLNKERADKERADSSAVAVASQD